VNTQIAGKSMTQSVEKVGYFWVILSESLDILPSTCASPPTNIRWFWIFFWTFLAKKSDVPLPVQGWG